MMFAQTLSFNEPAAVDTVGNTRMTVVYQYVCNTKDEYNMPISDSLLIVLQVGEGILKWFPYGRYMTQKDKSFNSLDYIYQETMMHVQTIFIDNVNGSIIGRETVGTICFETNEEKSYPAWILGSNNCKVLGYDCLNATGDFHGKKWMAQYTEDIPISAGPWKLGGLPGLILKAEDKDGIHSFEAVQVFADDTPIIFDKYYVVRRFTAKGVDDKRFDYQKKSLKDMISHRKSVFGHKNYPSNPMLFVTDGGYQEFRYGDFFDINVIDGVVVPNKAHKYQPLEDNL